MYANWRLCYLIGAIPIIYGIILFFVMHETPHFYANSGNKAKACQRLTEMEQATRHTTHVYDPDCLIVPPKPKKVGPTALFSSKFIVGTAAIWTGYFVGQFCVYGMNAWLPTWFTGIGYSAADSITLQTLNNVGYVDFYLLHNLGAERTAKFEEYGMWEFLSRKKAEGDIRNIGFSLHDDPDVLDELLTAHPEVDFVQLQVNYLDWDDPVIQSRALMEVAANHDKPVIIMEPVRGGRLAELPERAAAPLRAVDPAASMAAWAYRFCWNLPNVITVLSGSSTIEQMRENAASFKANRSFTDIERSALDEALDALRAVPTIPCTNCGYCLEGCPRCVAIPIIMMLLNLETMTGNSAFSKHNYSWQAEPGKASDCIECGACEAVCPQGISIIEHLRTAAEKYEK